MAIPGSEVLACMGGHCPKREECARYHAPFPARAHPSERLCKRPHFVMFFRQPREHVSIAELRKAA